MSDKSDTGKRKTSQKRLVNVNAYYDKAMLKQKASPLHEARIWLGVRLEETLDGYTLDGVPANLNVIMRETNRKRVLAGIEQITVCEAWVV